MELPDKSGAQPPKKEITPVVKGAKKVQRPATRRFLDFIFAESPKALAAKIGRDVVVPRLKESFEAAANSFLSGILWGDSANRPITGLLKGNTMRGSGVNYNAISSSQPGLLQARQANMSRSLGSYQDLALPSQEAAEFLLASMYDLLNQYRVVAVGDFYELAEITPPPSANAYGWTSLDGARISKVREGYLLELPRPSLI